MPAKSAPSVRSASDMVGLCGLCMRPLHRYGTCEPTGGLLVSGLSSANLLSRPQSPRGTENWVLIDSNKYPPELVKHGFQTPRSLISLLS